MMRTFTINDLERLSGIKAHTLRVWEIRYALLKPHRSERNFRSYSVDELKLLLHTVLLNTNGYKISQLATMSHEEITEKIYKLQSPGVKYDKAVYDLIISMYEMDTDNFEMVLNSAVITWGIDRVIGQIIYPFLEKTGMLWSSQYNIEEQLVVIFIRQLVTEGIAKTIIPFRHEKTALLFLPPGEYHDLALLYSHYIIKQMGLKIIHAGPGTSIKNLQHIIIDKTPDIVITCLGKLSFNLEVVQQYIDQNFPERVFIVAANPINSEQLISAKVKIVSDLRKMSDAIS